MEVQASLLLMLALVTCTVYTSGTPMAFRILEWKNILVSQPSGSTYCPGLDDNSSTETGEHPTAKELVNDYNNDTNWRSLRKGLKQVLDNSSVEYNQLSGVNDCSWGHLWQVGYSGSQELATFLMNAGLSPNKTDTIGDTMLHGAAEGGQIALAQTLLEHGADVNSRGWRGLTPFNKAALGGQTEMVAWLKDHGANINSADDNGMTSLHFAAEYGHLEVVRLLVSMDLDTKAKDKDELTPLDWARNNQHAAVEEYLSSYPH